MRTFNEDDVHYVRDVGRIHLRDYFAGLAMRGYLGKGYNSAEVVATLSYEMADAMLKARDEHKTGDV